VTAGDALAGVHHVAITVRDLGAAERFYVGVLGLRVLRRWPTADGAAERSLWLATASGDGQAGDGQPGDGHAGAFIALEAAPPSAVPATGVAPAGPRPPGHHLLALRIAPAQRAPWEARLAAAGVEVTHRSAYTIYFADPEGNLLGLSHHPDPAPAPAPGPGTPTPEAG